MSDHYPEHVKLRHVKDRSQTVGEFLDWLDTEGVYLCRYDSNDILYRTQEPLEEWLARFFEIDREKLADEKEEMVARMRTRAEGERG